MDPTMNFVVHREAHLALLNSGAMPNHIADVCTAMAALHGHGYVLRSFKVEQYAIRLDCENLNPRTHTTNKPPVFSVCLRATGVAGLQGEMFDEERQSIFAVLGEAGFA
jgi:hypothetical protein